MPEEQRVPEETKNGRFVTEEFDAVWPALMPCNLNQESISWPKGFICYFETF